MFSVIIATYNGEKFIIEQLDSIIKQTILPDKIYIFDDCSSDKTIELVSEWKTKNELQNVYILQNKDNKGYTRNFIEALFEVDDDYIFFCDQDDVWKNNKIEIYKNFWKKHSNNNLPMLLVSGYSITNENLNTISNAHVKPQIESEVLFKDFIKDCSYPGMTFCINRELKNKVKELFKSKYISYHDYFISLCAIKYGNMFCINQSLVLYRQHGKNQLGVSGKKQKSKSYWEKVLQQKCNENYIANYIFPDNNYIVNKTKFANNRMRHFTKRNILVTFFNLYNYLRFYDFKSYIADIYYLIFGENK